MSYVESKTLTVETSNSEKDSAKLLILPINTYEEITIGDIDKEITKIIKHLSEKDPIIESFVDKVVPRKKNMYKKLCNAVFIYVSEIKSPIKIPTFNKNQIDEKYDGDNNEKYYLAFYVLNYNYE